MVYRISHILGDLGSGFDTKNGFTDQHIFLNQGSGFNFGIGIAATQNVWGPGMRIEQKLWSDQRSIFW